MKSRRLFPRGAQWRSICAAMLWALSLTASGASQLLMSGETLRSGFLPGLIMLPDGTQLPTLDIVAATYGATIADDDVLLLDPATGVLGKASATTAYDVLVQRFALGNDLPRITATYMPDTARFRVGEGRLTINSLGTLTFVGAFNYAAYLELGGIGVQEFDFDSDTIPDSYETANGLNPLDPADAELDSDQDGLSNRDEFLAGTFANDPDSDGDGIIDGIDREPVLFSNICTGNDALLDATDIAFGSVVTCAASTSVQVGGNVIVRNGGALEIITPTTFFTNGFHAEQGGQLSVITRDPAGI